MDRDKALQDSQPTAQRGPNWLDEVIPVVSEMSKTAGLFLRGRVGMGLTVAAYSAAEVLESEKGKKLEDLKSEDLASDVLRGAAKGSLMKASFAGITKLKTGVAGQGVLLGLSGRLVDSSLNAKTYLKDKTSPLDKVMNATFNPTAMASDAVVFVAGHGMFKGLAKLNKGVSERPIVATALMGGTFGMASGSACELLRQQESGEQIDVGRAFGSGVKHAVMDGIASLPAGFQSDALARKQAAELSEYIGKQASELGKHVGKETHRMSGRVAREFRWRYWNDIAKIKPVEFGLIIPEEITSSPEWLAGMEAVTKLKQNGYKAYFVGGCVRDILLNKIPKDYDVVTNAPPHRVDALFPDGNYGGKAFAVKHAQINGFEVEIATFRCDGKYVDGKPIEVVPLDKIPINIAMREDAGRRDFTINTMLLEPESRTVYYYFNGPVDLLNKKIDTVDQPKVTFTADGSRMLRVATFASKLEGFEPTPRVVQGMADYAKTIHSTTNVLWGRELGKILMSANPVKGLKLLKESGLIREMLPELEQLDSPVGEQDPIHHPEGNTWTHTLMVVDHLAKSQKRNQNLMFSGLFHDIGKPDTQVRKDNGRITNHKHEKVGAEIVGDLGPRLVLGEANTAVIKDTVLRHMAMHGGPGMTASALYRYLSLPHIENLIELQDADALGRGKCCAPADGHGDGNQGSQRVFWEKALDEARNPSDANRAIDAKPLINGGDLRTIGYKPGPPVGDILDAVKWAQYQGTFSDAEGALEWVKENCETPESANLRSQAILLQQREKKRIKREKNRQQFKEQKQIEHQKRLEQSGQNDEQKP